MCFAGIPLAEDAGLTAFFTHIPWYILAMGNF
jgi:hypothetical protein